MKRNRIRLISLLLTVLLLVPVAQAAVDPQAEASLSVKFPYTGMEFELYHVANIGTNGSYEKTSAFEDCPVDLSGLNVGEVSTQAAALVGYVQLWQLPAAAKAAVNRSGTATFSGLEPGLYLLCAGTVTIRGTTYTAQPLLVCLPMKETQGEGWNYDVTLAPKPGEVVLPDEMTISRKVLKVWEDDAANMLRPQSVVVYLLRDGAIFDSVRLSAENNWRYRWDGLEADYIWTVVEKPVENYTVSMEQVGITTVITNTRTSEPQPGPTPTPPPGTTPEPGISPAPGDDPVPTPSAQPTPAPAVDPSVPTLPQTGQLWWPVPVLACVGLLLFTLGWFAGRREEDE